MLDDIVCPTHGWVSHASIHESAHAYIAWSRGIAFKYISVYPEVDILRSVTVGESMAGGLHMGRLPAAWIPQNVEEAMDVLVAGHLAEDLFFGHHAESSWQGDARVWGVGVNGLGIDPEAAAQIALSSRRRVTADLTAAATAVSDLAKLLTSSLNASGGTYSGFTSPIQLTEAQVFEALGPGSYK